MRSKKPPHRTNKPVPKAKPKPKAKARKSSTVFVAVIHTPHEEISKRDYGDYSCFIGTDKAEMLKRASQALSVWNRPGRDYVVSIGELHHTIELVPKLRSIRI